MKRICLFALTTCGAIFAQSLTVSPDRVLLDEDAAIRAAGLEPGEHVVIRSELTDGAGERWSAQGSFVADDKGAVETPAAGLIWSMMPESKRVPAYLAPRNLAQQTTEFELMRKGRKIAGTRLEQDSLASGVRRVAVREGELRGILFLPAGSERHAAVLVVGGSNGGVPARQGAWLASRGFVALSLAYFHYEDLPPMLEAIPLEYFQHAIAWLQGRPEAAGEHVGVMGTSRGGELALQLGSMFPAIGAVVAYVPANVRYPACCGKTRVPYAWTWQGRPLAYALPRFGGARSLQAEIEVERTHGPILMISGEDDRLWRSWEMADAVAARLKRHHFSYSFENLKYAHAGHSAGRPGIQPAWHAPTRHPISGRINDLGGSAQGDAHSTVDSMPKVLEFLRSSL